MRSIEKIKKWIPLVLLVLISQTGLIADEARPSVTVKLVNNTHYSLWLRVADPGCIARNQFGCTEDYWDVFGNNWLPAGEGAAIKSYDDAPRARATLYYTDVKNPGRFTYGTPLQLNFGKNSTAEKSNDVTVDIQAEPVDITQYSVFTGEYTTTWYNYTITVNPGSKKGSEDNKI